MAKRLLPVIVVLGIVGFLINFLYSQMNAPDPLAEQFERDAESAKALACRSGAKEFCD